MSDTAVEKKKNCISEAGFSVVFFFINPIAAVTGNEPESVRQLRQLRNYVEPKVTMSFSDTQQNWNVQYCK